MKTTIIAIDLPRIKVQARDGKMYNHQGYSRLGDEPEAGRQGGPRVLNSRVP